MHKQLNISKKSMIIVLKDEGYTISEISHRTQIPRSTVGRICKNYRNTRSLERQGISGRKKILNGDDLDILRSILNRNPKTTSKKIRLSLESKTKKLVSRRTLGRALTTLGFRARVAAQKPFITKSQKEKRFNYALEYLRKADSFWDHVIFSDECPFRLGINNRKVIVYRKNGTSLENKNLIPKFKSNKQTLMFWGCFSIKGIGRLVLLDESVTGARYVNMLTNNLSQSALEMGLAEYFFLQDNAPAHKANITMNFFELNKIEIVPHPPNSPDLNPIENIWAYIKQKLDNIDVKNLEELKSKIYEVWCGIPMEFIKRLVYSMKKRLIDCYQNKGGITRY